MKHRAFTLIEAAVVVAIIVILAAILMPVFNRGHKHGYERRTACQSNLKQIGLAFMQYVQDYDEKFPSIANARAGYWAGSLQPYVKSWQVFSVRAPKHRPLKRPIIITTRACRASRSKK